MKGDFSSYNFSAAKHFSRVLMQQGRVQLDSDWNEQVETFLHYVQTLANDLIGPHGGPPGASLGFRITKNWDDKNKVLRDLNIGKGRYYVNGLLCENDNDGVVYSRQANYPLTAEQQKNLFPDAPFVAFLDVWERPITSLEDAEIQEIGLGLNGPDTAMRTQVVWQIRTVKPYRLDTGVSYKEQLEKDFAGFLSDLNTAGIVTGPGTGLLRARAKNPSAEDLNDPCNLPPEARYRSEENRLYRVEIHHGGQAGSGATFKWSRDNGSVTFPVDTMALDTESKIITVTLKSLPRDTMLSLEPGNWVEIVDDSYVLQGRSEALFQVKAGVDPDTMQVVLESNGVTTLPTGQDKTQHPFLRRWDQRINDIKNAPEGVIAVTEDEWLDLEDGIQIQFQSPPAQPNDESKPVAVYYPGDYWLIPARAIINDVIWPGEVTNPQRVPARGVVHHYAPLAVITADTNPPTDLRRFIQPLTAAMP